MKNLVRAGVVLVVTLALTGCVKAEGLTELAEAEFRLACAEAGGDIRVADTLVITLQCVFEFPDFPPSGS